MQEDRATKLRVALGFQTLAMASAVGTVLLVVLDPESLRDLGRVRTLGYGLGTSALFLALFTLTAPLCRECRLHIWRVLERTHVCCFMEKIEIKGSVIRSFRFVGWFLMASGGLSFLQPQMVLGYRTLIEEVDRRVTDPAILRDRARLQAAEARVTREPGAPGPLADLAYLWIRSGRPDRALPLLEKARLARPNDRDLWALTAIALGAAGNRDEEISIWTRLQREDEKDVEASHNLGLALARAGKLAEAESSLRQAVKFAVQEIQRFKRVHGITPENKGNLGPEVLAQLDGLNYRAGNSAYRLALVAGAQKKPDKEEHLRLARYLGFETALFESDLRALAGGS